MEPGEIAEDQSPVMDFLADPASHGERDVQRIDTHGAVVFLAGHIAYKLKRAVWFPFLDFTSSAKRRDTCEAEIRLNRRTAPDLYIGTVPVTRDDDGRLAINGNGVSIDWLVVMHRFEQDLLFDQLAERNDLTSTHLLELTDHVVAFHQNAEIRKEDGGVAAMRWVVEDNMDELSAMSDIFAPDRIATLRKLSVAALENCVETLERRRAEGFVRHCHGDLHLRNICMFENKATLFDCIKFSDAIACIDTLYDLSFLLMDLEHRGRRDFANLVFNRYTALTGDTYGLANLPLFLSCRAAIRAKIAAATRLDDAVGASTMREEARAYAELAIDYLESEPPRLVAVGGQPGCGKSTLAQALAPSLGPAPGALIIRSDVLRKRRFGRAMFETLPQACYSAQATLKTYADLVEDATAALNAGMSVIVDAVFRNPYQRASINEVARQAGIPFTGIWLDAPRELRADRISGRGPDASDATADLVLKRADMSVGVMDWFIVDADQPIDVLVAHSQVLLNQK